MARVSPPYAASSSGQHPVADRGCADCSDPRWFRPRPRPGQRSRASARSSSRETSSSGPDDGASLRIDAAKPAEAGAAHQLEQERLGLVVRVCPTAMQVAPSRSRPRARESRSGGAARHPRSTAAASPAYAATSAASVDERETQRRREVAAELLVAVGRRPEPVVEVREPGDARSPPCSARSSSSARERHRVGAARQPDEHTAPGGHSAWRWIVRRIC